MIMAPVVGAPAFGSSSHVCVERPVAVKPPVQNPVGDSTRRGFGSR